MAGLAIWYVSDCSGTEFGYFGVFGFLVWSVFVVCGWWLDYDVWG